MARIELQNLHKTFGAVVAVNNLNFAIEDGEIAHPIKSLRFTQSYVEALRYTEAIGGTPRLLRSGMGGATSVPPVKLAKFRFTSSTR